MEKDKSGGVLRTKTILLTGATGFIGRNLLPLLQESYSVSAPSRQELDLLNADAVRRYLYIGQFDAVIHLANPTGHNPQDPQSELFERSLRVFSALEHCSDLFGKMIYLGSGAEYGKHRDISMISEDSFGAELPRDAYGLSRYIMSQLCEKHDNIVNLRLFACCGPDDMYHKLIPHIINCINERKTMELLQDVWFDFVYVIDILPVLQYFIEHPAKFKAYNLCSGKRIKISSIATEVRQQMGASSSIVFQKNGLGLEYTASNTRLCNELPHWKPRPINVAIQAILRHMGLK